MSECSSCVAIYDLQQQLEDSLGVLRVNGCDLHRVSVVGKGGYSDQCHFALYETAGEARFHGEQAGFWNRVYGILGSAGCFWVPGYGPFTVAGSMVAVLASSLDRQVITGQLHKLGVGLYTVGVSGDSALRYETMVSDGRLLLIVQGNLDEVERASNTIAVTEGVEMAVHAA